VAQPAQRADSLHRLVVSGRRPGVARQCGYASEVGFSRAFKRWFGMPPGEYRRRGA
jgi:transcriptional regulator GlxA family with amidase domain